MKELSIFANGLFAENYAGGDVHLFNVIKALQKRGTKMTFYSTELLNNYLERWGCDHVDIQDTALLPSEPHNRYGKPHLWKHQGKLRLLFHFAFRMIYTLFHSRESNAGYASTDYWYDVIPLVLFRFKNRTVMNQMLSPRLISCRTFSDFHFWASQRISYGLLRFCKNAKIITANDANRSRLMSFGFRHDQIFAIPNGVDTDTIDSVPSQNKIYDLIWIGRYHPQKGIDDLITVLHYAIATDPSFKAIILGPMDDIKPELEKRGIAKNVILRGFVDGAEKFKIIKQSRCLLSTSTKEGLPLVIPEAMACGVPVVCRELPGYRMHFGYVPNYCKNVDSMATTVMLDLKTCGGTSLSWNNVTDQIIDVLQSEPQK